MFTCVDLCSSSILEMDVLVMCFFFPVSLLTAPGPTVEQQAEMARSGGRVLASLLPEEVSGPGSPRVC